VESQQPAKLLDTQRTNKVEQISGVRVMDGAYLISCIEEGQFSHLFMAKVSAGSKKTKTKKSDVTLKLKEKGHSFFVQRVLDSTHVSVVYGNVFSMLRQDLSILDEDQPKDSAPKIRSLIELGALGEKQTHKKKKKD